MSEEDFLRGQTRRRLGLLTALALCALLVQPGISHAQPSEHTANQQASTPDLFHPGDRVALLGNTFAERLQLGGHFEAALLSALPEHGLVVRNLAWSADEVSLRPRPLNFGTVEQHLREQSIDVALLFYGANEAFAGASGVEAFKTELGRYLDRIALVARKRMPFAW